MNVKIANIVCVMNASAAIKKLMLVIIVTIAASMERVQIAGVVGVVMFIQVFADVEKLNASVENANLNITKLKKLQEEDSEK